MRLRAATATFAALTFGAAASYAAEPNREQGAHQHGHGSFNLAIEKSTVSIELRVPGNDLVGFEHAPKTDKQKKAIEGAKKTLADALKLFGVPKDAGCQVKDADVHMHGIGEEAGDHKHDPKPADAKAKTAKEPEKHDHADGHSSFHAKYTLTCSKPSAMTSLAFTYFKTFPGAEELEIVAISEKSQVKAEATRKKPTVSLRGLW